MQRVLTGTTDRHVDKLLSLLIDNAMVVVSGPKIANELRVTRSTVWRWIERLRGLGVRIKGHTATGYQLETIPDILVPQLIARRLAGSLFGKRIHHFFRAESTQDYAMRLAAEEEPHGTLVIAEEQTAGRGRFGRSWYSEKTSGIYFSMILRPPLAPVHALLLTLAAGLAGYDAVREVTGLAVDIRWPNDLLVNDKKFAGILTEMSAETERVHYVVVGVGLNVNHAKIPAELEPIATSLRLAAGQRFSRMEILVRLLGAFDRYYNQLLARDGAPSILGRWAAVSSYAAGKRVKVSTGAGEFTGTTAGLDATGLLRIRRENGETETVLAGDIVAV